MSRLAVVGVGGAGVNAVRRLADHRLPDARLIAVDASAAALARAGAAETMLLRNGTRGLGTGGDAGLGQAAARTDGRRLEALFDGAEVVLLAAGLAGGTGGGASPEVAEAARRAGALVLGFGIGPFSFERGGRARAAAAAARRLRRACDGYVHMDTARAQALAEGRLPLEVALRVADDTLRQAAQGLCALVQGGGWLGVDLAAVRDVLALGGEAMVAVGFGRGDAPATDAMRAALSNPLVRAERLAGARGAMVHVAGGRELAVADVRAAVARLGRRMPEDAALVVGAAPDPWLAGAAQVTVIAVGVAPAASARRAPAERQALVLEAV